MNRRWMIGAALAAVLAIIGGAYVGRNLLFDDAVTRTPTSDKPRKPEVIVFHETGSDVSLRYPSTWTRQRSTEQNVPLVAVAPGGAASLLLRVSITGLDDVTTESLPIFKKYTDPLVKADRTVRLLGEPQPVTLGGLLGYRYRYTYSAAAGAHDHYFLFKRGRMIALVFQSTPASRLDALQPEFERLARTFRGTGPT